MPLQRPLPLELGGAGPECILLAGPPDRSLGAASLEAFPDALTLVLTLARIWRHAAKTDLVVWFVSNRAALLAGSGVWLVWALRRRALYIRWFGGSFDRFLKAAPAPCRLIARRTF